MSPSIIIETLPSSDRSRRMVARTDLHPQGVVSVTESPVIGSERPFRVSLLTDSKYGSRDYAAKARPWEAISKRLA